MQKNSQMIANEGPRSKIRAEKTKRRVALLTNRTSEEAARAVGIGTATPTELAGVSMANLVRLELIMTTAKKDAIRAYKERKISRGIFTIRCKTTGHLWVESSRDLDAAEKRTFFLLRSGDVQIDKTAEAEFREYGPDMFSYEVLEKLDEDVAETAIRDLLRERKRHWLATLSARPLWPV